MYILTKCIFLSALVQVQGRYIVTLKSNPRSDPTLAHLNKVRALFPTSLRSENVNEIKHIFNTTFSGYSADFSDTVLTNVKGMLEVEAVEEDLIASVSAIQRNAPWGLARLSSSERLQRDSASYIHDPSAGEGVSVFVIDTGINIKHPEFQGRAIWGANFVNGSPNLDQNGHGTHCAGTIASKTYGVAKSATVVAVKVLDAQGQGYNSQIIAGIEWAIKNKANRQGNVINMSLGSGRSEATNRAVRAATRAGFVVAVAAGNENQDACNVSPASEPSVITVGATTINDARASFSNWGNCLDVFAPGDKILSTWKTGSTKYLSGTSMASPHVAGLAAYLISKRRSASPNEIANLMKSTSQRNAISSIGYGSPNLLISLNES